MELKYARWLDSQANLTVLIIPYGIEIELNKEMWEYTNVLIIPYGIEITWLGVSCTNMLSFNHTLWN